MGEHFHGWRRKVGAVTLALALVFMVGWIRSFSEVDQIEFLKDAQTLHVVYSCPAGIGWTMCREIRVVPKFTVGIGKFNSRTFHSNNHNGAYPFGWNAKPWESDWLGFRKISVYIEKGTTLEALKIWIVAYASIVIPLTLLSGFLLFGKRRSESRNVTLGLEKPSGLDDLVCSTS